MSSDDKRFELDDTVADLDPKAVTTMRRNSAKTVESEKRQVAMLTGRDLQDIQVNDHGWTSRVYIIDDGKIVFKFPRMKAVKKEYIEEIKIYKVLEQLDIQVQVPRLRWVGPRNDYFGYEGIVGAQLSARLGSLRDAEKRNIGRRVGEFLKQLHALDFPESHSMTVADEVRQAQEKYAGSSKLLTQYFGPKAIAKLDGFMHDLMPSAMQQLGGDIVLCHGDLGYWNMLLKDDGSLGLIDFGDTGYYDRSKDFCGLQDQTMLDAALAVYGEDDSIRRKIAIRQKYLPFFDLQYFTESGNEDETQATLQKIRTLLASN